MMRLLNCLKRQKVRFVGQGFSYPDYKGIVFVEDIRNGYAVYSSRFAKTWHSIMPKHLFVKI